MIVHRQVFQRLHTDSNFWILTVPKINYNKKNPVNSQKQSTETK